METYTYDEIVNVYLLGLKNEAYKHFLKLSSDSREDFLSHLYSIGEYAILRNFAVRLSGLAKN